MGPGPGAGCQAYYAGRRAVDGNRKSSHAPLLTIRVCVDHTATFQSPIARQHGRLQGRVRREPAFPHRRAFYHTSHTTTFRCRRDLHIRKWSQAAATARGGRRLSAVQRARMIAPVVASPEPSASLSGVRGGGDMSIWSSGGNASGSSRAARGRSSLSFLAEDADDARPAGGFAAGAPDRPVSGYSPASGLSAGSGRSPGGVRGGSASSSARARVNVSPRPEEEEQEDDHDVAASVSPRPSPRPSPGPVSDGGASPARSLRSERNASRASLSSTGGSAPSRQQQEGQDKAAVEASGSEAEESDSELAREERLAETRRAAQRRVTETLRRKRVQEQEAAKKSRGGTSALSSATASVPSKSVPSAAERSRKPSRRPRYTVDGRRIDLENVSRLSSSSDGVHHVPPRRKAQSVRGAQPLGQSASTNPGRSRGATNKAVRAKASHDLDFSELTAEQALAEATRAASQAAAAADRAAAAAAAAKAMPSAYDVSTDVDTPMPARQMPVPSQHPLESSDLVAHTSTSRASLPRSTGSYDSPKSEASRAVSHVTVSLENDEFVRRGQSPMRTAKRKAHRKTWATVLGDSGDSPSSKPSIDSVSSTPARVFGAAGDVSGLDGSISTMRETKSVSPRPATAGLQRSAAGSVTPTSVSMAISFQSPAKQEKPRPASHVMHTTVPHIVCVDLSQSPSESLQRGIAAVASPGDAVATAPELDLYLPTQSARSHATPSATRGVASAPDSLGPPERSPPVDAQPSSTSATPPPPPPEPQPVSNVGVVPGVETPGFGETNRSERSSGHSRASRMSRDTGLRDLSPIKMEQSNASPDVDVAGAAATPEEERQPRVFRDGWLEFGDDSPAPPLVSRWGKELGDGWEGAADVSGVASLPPTPAVSSRKWRGKTPGRMSATPKGALASPIIPPGLPSASKTGVSRTVRKGRKQQTAANPVWTALDGWLDLQLNSPLAAARQQEEGPRDSTA